MELQEISEEYHRQLLASSDGLEYFKENQISSSIIEKFQLGWITEAVSPKHSAFLSMPVVPYRVVGGRVIQIRCRPFEFDRLHMQDTGVLEKEYPIPQPEVHLFNVQNAIPNLVSNRVVIVEEIHSCLRLKMFGHRAIAVPGWGNWFEPWTQLFRESVSTFIFNEDREELAIPVLKEFKRKGLKYEAIRLPGHSIAATELEQHSVEELLSEYKVERMR